METKNVRLNRLGGNMSFYEELKARNAEQVKCFHFCNATQKYEFLGVIARKNINRLMPINNANSHFVKMSCGTMVAKYRFTELTDSTIPQL